MSRPKKWRSVCCLPKVDSFGPLNECHIHPLAVTMSVDEYETIRLIDYEGLKQEECAVRMNIARTTVQSIYEIARKKIADAIVNGKIIRIEGGEYILCNEDSKECCPHHGCGRYGKGFGGKCSQD